MSLADHPDSAFWPHFCDMTSVLHLAFSFMGFVAFVSISKIISDREMDLYSSKYQENKTCMY